MKKAIIVNLLLLLFLLTGGCTSKPSEAIVKQHIEQKINKNSKGIIKLVGFHKTNGIEQEFFGKKVYEMEWIADLEFTDDCMWNSKFYTFSIGDKFQKFMGTDKAAKGDRVSFEGTTKLEKTEKGWRIMGL